MTFESAVTKIKVIGVGGGGVSTINDMVDSKIDGIEFIAADIVMPSNSKAQIKMQLSLSDEFAKGSGGDPANGIKGAEEVVDQIREVLSDTNMLFITTCFGGGTGTGASQVIAREAKALGILTVAVATKPFSFEGRRITSLAMSGIEELKKYVDIIVIIENDKLLDLPNKKITVKNAFIEANSMLKIGINTMSKLLINPGYINLDFADVTSTMKDAGVAIFGFGEGEGENRCQMATDQALQSPLLDRSILGAENIMVNICGSDDLRLEEASDIMDYIRKYTKNDSENVFFGISEDNTLGNKIQVSIIATNFKDVSVLGTNSYREEQKKGNLDIIDIPPHLRNKK